MALRTLEAGAEPQATLESCHRLFLACEIVLPDVIGPLTQ